MRCVYPTENDGIVLITKMFYLQFKIKVTEESLCSVDICGNRYLIRVYFCEDNDKNATQNSESGNIEK